MKPLVSILIAAFNAQDSITETLRSAIGQTWQHKEVIVVDDGSTDRTLAIARRFESGNVCVVTQRNQGPSAARDVAFSMCQGDYIQWLDADDLLAPDKIARQVEALDLCPSRRTVLSSAWARFLYRHHRARFIPDSLWCDLSPLEFLLRKVQQNIFMPLHSWLISRELSAAAGPWDHTLIIDNDGEYLCRILLASDCVRFVPEARVYYRLSGAGSISNLDRSNEKLEAQWRSMQLHMEYLRSMEDSERVHAACVRFLQDWLIYFFDERPDIVEQARRIARAWGAELPPPQLSWKYSWMVPLFGWSLAKHARVFLPNLKLSLMRHWDRALYRAELCRCNGIAGPTVGPAVGSPRNTNSADKARGSN